MFLAEIKSTYRNNNIEIPKLLEYEYQNTYYENIYLIFFEI